MGEKVKPLPPLPENDGEELKKVVELEPIDK